MKDSKNKSWLVLNIGLFATAAILIVVLLIFCLYSDSKSNRGFKNDSQQGLVENVTTIKDDNYKPVDSDVDEDVVYLLINENDTACIYEVRNNTREFYDFADFEIKLLPEADKENLKNGIFFKNQKELYDFLQTYSS